jgi:hypothetical protein
MHSSRALGCPLTPLIQLTDGIEEAEVVFDVAGLLAGFPGPLLLADLDKKITQQLPSRITFSI